MAEKKIYFGSVGPFLYDDADTIDDVDGDFAGQTMHGVVTNGQVIVETAPTDNSHVVRKSDLLALLYPIGTVYISATSTSPATLFGGTWAAIEGKFIATYKNGDADFGTPAGTGGAKTAAHDNNHTGTAVVAHPETANVQGAAAGDVVTDGVHTVTQPDAHSNHAILPPYKVFYAWERTA